MEQHKDAPPGSSVPVLQPTFPVYLSCKWPVYNQQTIYHCVQMSHAGNDKIL